MSEPSPEAEPGFSADDEEPSELPAGFEASDPGLSAEEDPSDTSVGFSAEPVPLSELPLEAELSDPPSAEPESSAGAGVGAGVVGGNWQVPLFFFFPDWTQTKPSEQGQEPM